MRLSSHVKLMSTFGLLFVIAASLTIIGATRGISHASGTLHKASTQAGDTTFSASSCGSWQNVPVRYPPMGGGNFGFDGVAAVSSNNIWAVGSYTEHWDGTKWSKVNPQVGLNGIAAISASNIWAVGGTNGSSVDGVSHLGGDAVIEHWNGTKWSLVSGANLGSISSYLNALTVISANNIWAVGIDENGPLIEHWNGISWSAVNSPSQNVPNFQYYELKSISAISANDIWTVGGYAAGWSSATPYTQSLIEHWNGKAWSIISSPNPLIFNHLYGVTAISRNNVWAVGDTYDNTTGESVIEHWDGNGWSISTSTVGDGLSAITANSANNIWAVGTSSNGGLTEHWDGSSWSIIKSAKGPGISLLAMTSVPQTSTFWAVGTDWPSMSDYSNMVSEFYC